uniref:LIM zinc-binding domain-containing protein n=1 Tax=Onchocerca volvulus TaxID=6282 RepID=A0A8R1Y1A6_ONCVO
MYIFMLLIWSAVGMEGLLDARCGKCSETVNNDGFIANNRLWHRDHFHCSRCRANITREYYVDDGNVVCVSCTLARPKLCHKCEHVINETYLKAMGYCWHQKCFLCYGCKKPFPSAKYWLLNGHPYDSDCYWGARLDAQYFAE